jgi:signal transduction histidine kinase
VAEQNRSTSELMQDILSHDVRNFTQVSKASAELLREELLDRHPSPLLDSIERAADNTRDLIERMKKLTKIVNQATELCPIELSGSIERAVRVITDANPDKRIAVSHNLPSIHSSLPARVRADELLDEVFVNILSNSAKYTDGNEVCIEIHLEEFGLDGHGQGDSKNGQYWKVAISDSGRGIKDDVKKTVFTRYQKSASGSGLGLSIVYALVVGRYGGRVRVQDRVPGDYSKGTRMEVLLPRA